jgi:transposase
LYDLLGKQCLEGGRRAQAEFTVQGLNRARKRYLARVLGKAAVAAARTDSFLGERNRRIARRRGAKKAIVAVGRSILVIAWRPVSNPQARSHDLGSDFFSQKINPERRKRAHVHQLEALGYKVTLEPAA